MKNSLKQIKGLLILMIIMLGLILWSLPSAAQNVLTRPMSFIGIYYDIDEGDPYIAFNVDVGMINVGDTVGYQLRGVDYSLELIFDEELNTAQNDIILYADDDDVKEMMHHGVELLKINSNHYYFNRVASWKTKHKAKKAFKGYFHK